MKRSTTRLSSLKLMYEGGKTTREIATETGIPSRTVSRWLRQAGVAMRKPGQNLRHMPLNDPKWLRNQYWKLNRSCLQIAKVIGCESTRVNAAMYRHGIPTRKTNEGRTFPESGAKVSAALKGRFAGSKNPNWRGDAVKRYRRERNSYQSRKWSLDVRARDGHQCVKCGALNQRLHAHHIKEFRRNKKLRYELSNGVTLCIPCHQKEHDRQFPNWIISQGKKPTSADRPQGR